jgi:hypothetical protein
MDIIKVINKSQIEEFHNLVYSIYKENKNWIPHVQQDIETIFNPNKNSYHKKGEIERFILQKNNKTIGRIAVFYNYQNNQKDSLKTGGVGFFECINNQAAANTLFETSVSWLKERNIEAMDGPINFGEKEKYWGLMVEGFEKPTIYGQNYHLSYYKDLFEQFGFKAYYNQHVYCKDLKQPYPDKFYERAARIKSRPDFLIDHMKNYDFKKYAKYFVEIYNAAWGTHHTFKPLKTEQAEKMFEKMKPIIDQRLIWFGFYKEIPICFFIAIPDINQYFKYINGNLNMIGKLKFLFHKTFNKSDTVAALVFGVTPKFQKLGLESALAEKTTEEMLKDGYKKVIQSWIGDFNPKMIKVCENFLGSDIYQKLTTYRYLFDKKAVFKPHPIIK